ncbi:hypothetical protein LEMLEM_LOCUS6288 [Lemmus lemmus]
MTLKARFSRLYISNAGTLHLVSAVLEMKPPNFMYATQAIHLLCYFPSPFSLF